MMMALFPSTKEAAGGAATDLKHAKYPFVSLAWYVFFGMLHEVVHVSMAVWLGLGENLDSVPVFCLRAALGRACTIPALSLDANQHPADDLLWKAAVVRHAGWIFSVILAFGLWTLKKKNHQDKNNEASSMFFSSACQTAAIITALEALCTDLVGLGGSDMTQRGVFLCGNFGVILLHPAWTTAAGDYGKTALDLLEKMVEVTMMRGAQTGGVVTWTNDNRKAGGGVKAIRSRVVNGKRTDLSKEIRRKLNKDITKGGKLMPSIRCLMGHTRFATSSKATMGGTHPHTWCPPEFRRSYPMEDISLWNKNNAPTPIVRLESNYITHNGDLDFFKINGHHNDLETVQKWLELATGHPMPATVDSAAIAGLVDILRTAGCWGLSIRYALVVACQKGTMPTETALPVYQAYETLGMHFEESLKEYCTKHNCCLTDLKICLKTRQKFADHVNATLPESDRFKKSTLSKMFTTESGDNLEIGSEKISVHEFVLKTVEAFFENDLFGTTKLFLKQAVGSFGLMVTSSMEAQRQICIAARGQPMSMVFYPEKGLITYGSELAAVKAGLTFDAPGKLLIPHATQDKDGKFDVTKENCRFDLDDLGGEVVLVDFSEKAPDGRSIPKIQAHQESKTTGANLKDRTTILANNEFLLPLTKTAKDPIEDDLLSIPAALGAIQEDWRNGGLNRVTAWSLGRCLRQRLKDRVNGKIPINGSTVDVLITGCEVSLWLGEQFASDLQKAFPKLFIQATSSNKLLGVFGQELAVPAIGFPLSEKVPNLKDTIVIIVSHSGGTFAPLAVSNLLQSMTRNIFVVSSEWDTQIGKQLRSMNAAERDFLTSRVFTTNIGVRPAEPCSLSVVATHQLLTLIFEYMCMVVLSDQHFRHLAGAVVTERDLQVLERCNQDCILALEKIVGCTTAGERKSTDQKEELQAAGRLWADHILENARAYIMSFVYVVITVTIGYPLITGLATGAGLKNDWAFYATRFLDSLIYFFLPQINIIFLRLIQGRNLRHRMVGRTAVIGDIPWVAQSAEAFLSKIFARSYSIAGLGVLSGNPADHLVHRHTHRVVRGSLLVCGRPDGRLPALISGECAVNLSVNQASSIQSIGGTCESITIGHNPAQLGLTKMDITLPSCRPKFLCEKILGVIDKADRATSRKQAAVKKETSPRRTPGRSVCTISEDSSSLDQSVPNLDQSVPNQIRSSHNLKGLYLGLQEQSNRRLVIPETRSQADHSHPLLEVDEESLPESDSSATIEEASVEEQVLASLLQANQKSIGLREIFDKLDGDGSGKIDLEEFVMAYESLNSGLYREEIETIFREADVDESGELDFDEFRQVMGLSDLEVLRKLQQAAFRDTHGLLQVEATTESYFGEAISNSKALCAVGDFAKSLSQHFSMELYESRVASLQRFVAMCVMFHQTGKQVQDFFPKHSFGLMNYNMERTHSIMRIATTASPVSGDAVRGQMERLRLRARYLGAVHKIESAWRRAHLNLTRDLKKEHQISRAAQSVVWLKASPPVPGSSTSLARGRAQKVGDSECSC